MPPTRIAALRRRVRNKTTHPGRSTPDRLLSTRKVLITKPRRRTVKL